ncbi:heterokaryon incompatibility protein, partial [Metarhizium majus ARSEF 297]
MDPTPDPPLQRIQYKPLGASRNEIRVLSFETSSRPDDLSGRLDRILGLGPARLTLEHVSLDDWKPEYQPQTVFRTVARFTWGDYTAISYMRGSPEKTKTITINGMPVVVGTNLAAAIDCLRSRPLCKIWVDAVCINQDDVNERNAHVMRIREIFGQSFAVTVWLGEDEMSSTGLNSWVEETFDKLRCCGTILAAHDKRTLEAALGIDVRAWESDHDYDELEDFFSSDVLYFDNEWWADSDDEDEFGPPHFRDLVAIALLRLFQNPYWSRLTLMRRPC